MEAAGSSFLDLHRDGDHHRSVLTLAGPDGVLEESVRVLARATLALVDLQAHQGVHPRLGALDVVPFVPLDPAGSPLPPSGDLGEALAARDRFGAWAGRELDLPCFYYGPDRSLPEIRREAFRAVRPDTGPDRPHPTAGASAVGARFALVAYNLWLTGREPALARSVAAALRGPGIRTLGLDVGGKAQVSCNLVSPLEVGPAEVYDAGALLARDRGCRIERAELVGLVPGAVLEAVDPRRWAELDLAADRTVEARLAGRT